MGLKDNWYTREAGYRWARSPATLFVSMPRARAAALEITPGAMYQPTDDQTIGRQGMLRVELNGHPLTTVAMTTGETTSVSLDLPAGVHTVTLSLEAGNFRPSDAGGGDTRLLSFAIQSVNLALAK